MVTSVIVIVEIGMYVFFGSNALISCIWLSLVAVESCVMLTLCKHVQC